MGRKAKNASPEVSPTESYEGIANTVDGIPVAEATPAEKKTRKPREKTLYVLETMVNAAWESAGIGNAFDDVPSAKAYVTANGLTGSFRVVNVRATFTASKVEAVQIS